MTQISPRETAEEEIRPGVYWFDSSDGRHELPALEWSITTHEWSNTATITFDARSELWPDGFDIATAEIFVTVQIGFAVPGAESVLFAGSLSGPQPIDPHADEFRLTFIETSDLEMQLPVTADYVGDIPIGGLASALFGFLSWPGSVTYEPPFPYPTLPGSVVEIYNSDGASPYQASALYKGIVDWMIYRGWSVEVNGDVITNPNIYLYYDEPSGDTGFNPYWFPGAFDRPEIDAYPNQISVVTERYEVHPDGVLKRYTLVDNAGDGDPPFLPEELNRSAYFPPASAVSRDIRAAQLSTVGSQLRSIAEEVGLRRVVNRLTPNQGVSYQELTNAAPLDEKRIDGHEIVSWRKIVGTGGITHVAMQGVDGAWAVAGAVTPGTATRVVRVRAEIGPDFIQQAADAYLDALDEPTEGLEVTIDIPVLFRTEVNGISSPYLPKVGDQIYAILNNNAADPRVPRDFDSPEIVTGLCGGVAYTADRDGKVQGTLTVGKPIPTVQELLSRVV